VPLILLDLVHQASHISLLTTDSDHDITITVGSLYAYAYSNYEHSRVIVTSSC
jgi:hypothetical protein